MGGLNQAWHQLSLDFSLQFHDGRYISSTAAKRKYKYKYKYNCKYMYNYKPKYNQTAQMQIDILSPPPQTFMFFDVDHHG